MKTDEKYDSEKFIKKEECFNIHKCQGRYTAPHEHQFLELAYVTDGKAIHKINGANSTEIKKGDYFIIDYGTNHEYYGTTDNICVINCLFLPELIDKSLIYCKDFQTLIRHYLIKINSNSMNFSLANHIFHDDNGKILDILSEMLDEYREKQNNYTELIRSDLIRLLVLTARKISAIENNADITQKIINEINRRYNENLTLSGIIEHMNYSLPYISKLFKVKTGLTFQQYLKKVRINEASRLLAHTDKKIEEISVLSGYNDTDCFRKAFKELICLTPNEFRHKLNEN